MNLREMDNRAFDRIEAAAGTLDPELQANARRLIDGLFDERLAPMTYPEALDRLFAPVEDTG